MIHENATSWFTKKAGKIKNLKNGKIEKIGKLKKSKNQIEKFKEIG